MNGRLNIEFFEGEYCTVEFSYSHTAVCFSGANFHAVLYRMHITRLPLNSICYLLCSLR